MSKTLERLVKLGNLQVAIEAEIADLEARLKDRNKDLKKVSEEDLPDLMMELGMMEFKLTSGKTVKVKQDFYAKIPEARFTEAVAWLDGRGFGGIVKATVTAPFGMSERDKALELVDNLKHHGVAVEMKQGIHPSTLKSFIKERLEKEERIPFDLFGIVPFNKAVIS